ncbi:hypothetical protein WA026_018657 [Henosepilachna vigintioctopunctata]|uniref:Chitin-binding type-2 domain-containing protein n=1 Tax=Henosepilachna vigintioctopunctata TaxID=420089 RepID=A0AAW1UA21_9CUCU
MLFMIMVKMILSLLLFSLAVSANALGPCEIVGQMKWDPENCFNFYECTRDGWKLYRCQDGMVFKKDKGRCDYFMPGTQCKENLGRNGNYAQGNVLRLESCENVGQMKWDPESCFNFYECTRDGWKLYRCQDGMVFKKDKGRCDYFMPGTQCKENLGRNGNYAQGNVLRLDPCDNVGDLKPDPKYCNRFYQCTNNGWASLQCQPPTVFNPEILRCDWEKNVDCKN